MFYIVSAQVVSEKNGWRCSVQAPSFYLNSDVQGIRDAAHAEHIAESILKAGNPDAEVHAYAVAVFEL
jgi:hypothetical protein